MVDVRGREGINIVGGMFSRKIISSYRPSPPPLPTLMAAELFFDGLDTELNNDANCFDFLDPVDLINDPTNQRSLLKKKEREIDSLSVQKEKKREVEKIRRIGVNEQFDVLTELLDEISPNNPNPKKKKIPKKSTLNRIDTIARTVKVLKSLRDRLAVVDPDNLSQDITTTSTSTSTSTQQSIPESNFFPATMLTNSNSNSNSNNVPMMLVPLPPRNVLVPWLAAMNREVEGGGLVKNHMPASLTTVNLTPPSNTNNIKDKLILPRKDSIEQDSLFMRFMEGQDASQFGEIADGEFSDNNQNKRKNSVDECASGTKKRSALAHCA